MDTNYGKTAMNKNFSSLIQAQGEKRLRELEKAARSLGSLVAGEQLERGTVINSLLSACKKNGLHKELGEPEVMTLIRAGIAEGMKTPKGPAKAKTSEKNELPF